MKLFVYGTLKKGFSRHGALEGAKLISDDVDVENAILLDVGSYPLLLPSLDQNDVVLGELYEVDEGHIATCDLIETGYVKANVTAWCRDKHGDYDSQSAITYTYDLTNGIPAVPKDAEGKYIWNKQG